METIHYILDNWDYLLTLTCTEAIDSDEEQKC